MAARKRRTRKPDIEKASAEQAGRKHPFRPIRVAVLRGLAVVLPPLLTIVIFLWIGGTIQQYVLKPFTAVARDIIVWSILDIREFEELPPAERSLRKRAETDPSLEKNFDYQALANGTYIPTKVFRDVKDSPRTESLPENGRGFYRRYVELTYLQPYQVIPYFLCGFILVLYLLGKFMAAGAGRFFWGNFERGITRVPFVRNVYSSVKQVSDFLLSERNIEYSRVVAVEWPRKGVWCLALVTGSSLKDIQAAANEEVLSVLVCTSPMPMTGFTVTVKKRETIDLNISIDQAIQFIVSCGVVVPPDQMEKMQAPPGGPRRVTAAGESSKTAGGDS